MATLGLKEMGKFLWEGREKVLPSWLSQFSFWKMQRKTWYYILRVDAMPLSLKNQLLKGRKTAIYQLQILGITLYVFFAFLSYLIMHKK